MRHEHIDGVEVKAHFSMESELHYRYRLEIILKGAAPTGNTVCVVMQNPSYAGEDVADKSVQFMEKVVFKKGLAEFEGVSRLIVVNQFARIQTNGFEGLPHEVGSLNDAAIKNAVQESDIVVLAWGSANRFEERKAFVLGLLGEMKQKTLLKTRMHPSRGRYDGFIQPYQLARYPEEMLLEGAEELFRENGGSIFSTFSSTNGDDASGKVEILNP